MAAAPAPRQMPVLKDLASSDRKRRTASLQKLKDELETLPSLPLQDAELMWTGLYYAFWMTDRPQPQAALAADLAAICLRIPGHCAVPFLAGFWSVVSSKWTTIDNFRMDKFMLLTRRVFGAQLAVAKARAYAGAEIDALRADVLRAWCFEAEGDLGKVPLGLRLHLLDLWVDELEAEGCLEDEAASEFVQDMGNMVAALFTSPIKQVRLRSKETHADERLPWVEQKEDDEDEGMDKTGGDDEWGGIED